MSSSSIESWSIDEVEAEAVGLHLGMESELRLELAEDSIDTQLGRFDDIAEPTAEELDEIESEHDTDLQTTDTVIFMARRAGRTALLGSRTLERVLAQRMEQGDQAAKNRLIEANLRLVFPIARHYMGHNVPLPDLIQEGNLGLMHAIERFDWRKGYKISTYATWWVRQACGRALTDTARVVRLPAHVVERELKLKKVEGELAKKLGRQATESELKHEAVEARGIMTTKQYDALTSAGRAVALVAEGQEDDDYIVPDLKTDLTDTTVDETIKNNHLLGLKSLMSAAELNEREIRALTLRYGLEDGEHKTLERVAGLMNVTRERIRQIEVNAFKKMRKVADVEDFI
jgi:RNA polymerase primary sigma factor